MIKSIQLPKGMSWYISLLLLWGTLLACAMTLHSKAELFLWVNHARCPIMDYLGTIFTNMGDGIFTIVLILFFLFTKKRSLAWLLLGSFLLSTLFCQVLKNIAPEMRPAGYFVDPSIVKTASWISLKHFNSFPSGHTTTAFATATILAFYYRRASVSFVCFAWAVMVGYSRVYLGQHFVGDVFTGSILGAIASCICILNYQSPIIQKGLGLEYLFRKNQAKNE